MAVASLLRAHGLRFAAGLCSKLGVHLAGCKTLASSNFASQPIRSSSTARNHLRRLGMGLSRPPESRFFASTSRLVDAAAAVAFALHYRSPSRHRDVTAPLIARAAPRRRRNPQLGSGYLVWAGLHNNSPPALQQPGHEPKDGVAQPAHGPGQGRRGGLLALPAPRSAAKHLRAVALTCSEAASGRRAATTSHLCGRLLLFMLVFLVVSQ